MLLTEELLTEWTGLKGRELSIFYLTYKKHSSSSMLHTDLEYIKQDILKFKKELDDNRCVKEIQEKSSVKNLIKLWESKTKN